MGAERSTLVTSPEALQFTLHQVHGVHLISWIEGCPKHAMSDAYSLGAQNLRSEMTTTFCIVFDTDHHLGSQTPLAATFVIDKVK